MKATNRSLQDMLAHEEQEMQRRFFALRRVRQKPVDVMDSPERRSTSWFDAAATEASEQHQELLCRLLADRSQALMAARDRIREGRYGLCESCGGPIPQRRLKVLPTAKLCLPCQERRERREAAIAA